MKMRGNQELVALRNIYCFTALLILIASFAGSTTGSCLSYGHSCWGAHGKRSGSGGSHPLENVAGGDKRLDAPPSLGDRWLYSRLVNRQPMQVARLRAKMLPGLDDELQLQPEFKHSTGLEKLSGDEDIRDMMKDEQRISPDILLIPQHKDLADDQAIKFGLYKIWKNIDEKLK